MTHEELVKQLKDRAERFDYDGWVDTAIILEQAANAIEELSKRVQYFERKERWEREQRVPFH